MGRNIELMTEAEVLNKLGLNKKQLDYLRREKGFPCIHLTSRTRVYLWADIVKYIKNKKIDKETDEFRRKVLWIRRKILG